MSKQSIRVTKLDNGLTIATDTMDTVESVSIGIWSNIGARNETATNNGVAHFLEHMVFKGTTSRTARQIAEEIESVGGHLNAYTSREMTAYYARVLKENLPLAFDLVSDVLLNATFDAQEMERERGVILQEIGMYQDSPDDLIFDLAQQTAFDNHPVGRPILGTLDTVRNLQRNDIADFMHSNYTAPNLVLAASGQVDHDALVAMAQNRLSSLNTHKTQPSETAIYTGGEKRVIKNLEQAHLLMGFEGINYHDSNFYTASVLSTLLGGGMSSRLFQEIREKRGLVYSIYSFSVNYRDTGLFGIYAGTGANEVEELIPVVCDELLSVTTSVTEQELSRAKAQIKSGILMALENTGNRCERLARSMIQFGKPRTIDEITTLIDAIDINDVQKVAAGLFKPNTMTLTALGPIEKLEQYDTIKSRFAA